MDNFRKRSPKPRRKLDGIDGFIRKPNTSVENTKIKNNPQHMQGAASIDTGFSQKEGFWPRKTNQTPDGKRLGRRPLKVSSIDMTIDEEKISKKRFGKAKKSKKKIIIGIVVVLLLCMGVDIGCGIRRIRYFREVETRLSLTAK
jgi:hypothetical protein